ncbi:CidA/LrgA family protein [Lysinibacillus sp. 54212]|uniref:CidA/LrgA family protein n=1 Tax=Lysinibacillus sp. 54212 TaxID=3119829 RepID=UPI002FC64BE6
MRILRIIAQIGILTIYYYLGVLIVELTGIIIPASIIGLILLWLSLYFKLIKVGYIQDGAGFMLAFLTLFFIPSTAGVIEYPELLTMAGFYLVLAVIISTLFTIWIAGKVSQFIEKKEQSEQEETEYAASASRASSHR